MDSSPEPTDPGGTDPTRPAAGEEPEAPTFENGSGPRTDPERGRRAKPWLVTGFVVAVALALAAGCAVLLLVRNDDSSSSVATQTITTVATTPTTAPSTSASTPRATSQAELERLSAAGSPVYWAGPAEPGFTLTLVKGTNGTIYVRYLPEGVNVTDAIPPSLVVATYPLKGALAAVKRAAKASDSVTVAIANGGTAVYSTSKLTNVYFAYPTSSAQIEVYDPSPGRALQLVTSGTITPVTP